MLWEMEYQEKGFSIESGMKKNRYVDRDVLTAEEIKAGKQPFPRWFLNKPELEPGDEYFLTAFNRLSTCRQNGMALGPIPWNMVMEYADREQLNDELRNILLVIIEEMDNVYLTTQNEKQKTAMKSNKPSVKPR